MDLPSQGAEPVSRDEGAMRVASWNPKEADERLRGNVMERLQAIGEKVAQDARGRVPVGKDVPQGKGKWSKREAGALKKSIRVVRLHGDPKMNVRVYAGNREVYYARFVEYGTVKMKAKPFLRPALNAAKKDLL